MARRSFLTDEQKPKAWNGEPPTYTQVPNALFDVAMCDMGAAELKVVLAVIRKTIGWHKQRDAISLSQLEEMTGLARANVIRGVREAAKNGWIRHYKAGRTSYYELALREKIDADGIAAIPPSDGITAIPPMVLQQYQNGIAAVPEMVSQQYTQKKGKKERKKGKENSLARATRGAGADAERTPFADQPQTQMTEAAAPAPTPIAAPIPEQPRIDAALSDEPVTPNPEAAKRVRKVQRALSEHEAARHKELFDGIATVCVLDAKLMGGRIARTAKQLREADAAADGASMTAFLEWWKVSDFRGRAGKPPTLDQVVTSWKLFRENYGERPRANAAGGGKRAPMTVDRIKASLDF